MNVTQISIGRFHHFNLARQLQINGLLNAIYTGYPAFKLKDEQGIPAEKIRTYPWVRGPFMMRGRLGLDKWDWLNKEWEWLAQQTLDKHVASKLTEPTVIMALSGSGFYAGRKAQQLGGYFICDRGSSHIRYQNDILQEEYNIWGFKYPGIDHRVIAKEEAEYDACDIITIPSQFVYDSFISRGIPGEKLRKVTYGARLERFSKVGEPDSNKFRILWVGSVDLRKGFLYLLKAFQELKHPGKELFVIGKMSPEVELLLRNEDLAGVTFAGNIDNKLLPQYYSTSHVFVLPSLEEGLAMVMGEALSCGCPVIATTNTGAEDLFDNEKEGFIIPIRSIKLLKERLELLMDNRTLQQEMSFAAIEKVKLLGGWSSYGNQFINVLDSLQAIIAE